MKKIISTALLLFVAFTAYGAEETRFDKFLTANTLTASFTQTNHYEGIDDYSLQGKVYVSRPERALWDYSEPVEYYLLRSGRISHYSAELEQLVNIKVDSSKADEPSSVILGIFLDSSTVRKRFNIKDDGDIVELTPKNDIGVKSVIIKFDKDRLKSVYSIDDDGNSILIEFRDVVMGGAIPKSVFDKTVPPGTSVYEQ